MRKVLFLLLLPSLSFASGIYNPGSSSGAGSVSSTNTYTGGNVFGGYVTFSGSTTVTASTVTATNTYWDLTTSSLTTTSLNSKAFSLTPKSVNASYTALAMDGVILASSTVNGITITLPAASTRTGQTLIISKVDQTTNTVTIQANGSEVINGTGTIRFNAYTQTASILSDGSRWIPWGQGIQWTPNFVGPGFQSNTANTINSSSVPVCGSFSTQAPVAVDSITVHIGTPSGVIDVGIYDNSGNRLGSAGSISGYGAGRQAIPLTSILQLPPGGPYWMCLVADNTTATFFSATATAQQFVGGRSCAQAVGNVPLPATLPFPCTITTRVVNYDLWGHVVGGSL